MKKLTDKGFTIVELLTSFSLATVVLILLFNILISVKEGYLKSKALTETTNWHTTISQIMNDDALNYDVIEVSQSSNNYIVSVNSDSIKYIQYTFENKKFTSKVCKKSGTSCTLETVYDYKLPSSVSINTSAIGIKNVTGNIKYSYISVPLVMKDSIRDNKTFLIKVFYYLD